MTDVTSHLRRQDLARLLHERRWKPPELAQRFHCSVRTVQRDLEFFGDEMGEPVPMDDAGYYLNPGMHPVPSISLTTHEARALLFAMRLFLRNADELDEDGLTLLGKLGAAFPGVMANYAALTADELRERPQNRLRAGILRRLTDAWISRRTVLLSYASPGRRARSLTFDPYLLEPGRANSTAYAIGYSHEHGEVRTFAIDRVRSCEYTRHGFAPVDVANTVRRMSMSWSGIVSQEGEEHVVVEFSPAVAQRVRESSWHPSRRFEDLEDGGVRLFLTLPVLFDFVPWVLGWGAEARVVAPMALREQVAGQMKRAFAHYA